jgi:hypothetical protein
MQVLLEDAADAKKINTARSVPGCQRGSAS